MRPNLHAGAFPEDLRGVAKFTYAKQFEFKLVFFDRIALRDEESDTFKALNSLGTQGWRMVQIREDSRHERDFAVFMEREVSTQPLRG